MKVLELAQYLIKKDKNLDYYTLTRTIYAMQYESIYETGKPLVTDAVFRAQYSNLVTEDTLRNNYSFYPTPSLQSLLGDNLPDIVPENEERVLALYDECSDVVINDSRYFGPDSLVNMIWNQYLKNNKSTGLMVVKPPITNAMIDQFVNGHTSLSTPVKEKMTLNAYLRRFIISILGKPIDLQAYGLSTYAIPFTWTIDMAPGYQVYIRVMAQDKNEPIILRASLLCAGCMIETKDFNQIPDKIVFEHTGNEFEVEIEDKR